jgi:hypothetical protein
MIDYYETKSQPITSGMVWQAYRKVRFNKGGMGADEMSWEELDKTSINFVDSFKKNLLAVSSVILVIIFGIITVTLPSFNN